MGNYLPNPIHMMTLSYSRLLPQDADVCDLYAPIPRDGARYVLKRV